MVTLDLSTRRGRSVMEVADVLLEDGQRGGGGCSIIGEKKERSD